MTWSTISKSSVRRSFSRSSATYDRFSFVQNRVNAVLLDTIPDMPFDTVLEIGCGTGGFTKSLLEKRQTGSLFLIDLSLDMVNEARKRLSPIKDINFICCDAEYLPLRQEKRFDLIVSASCMHWFQDLEGSISSIIKNFLKKEGFFACAIFGSNTLIELQQVIDKLTKGEKSLPTASFPSRRKIEPLLRANLRDFTIETVIIKKEYHSLMELLIALKRTGTAPATGTRPVFRTREQIHQAEREYARLFGSLSATFEVFIASGFGNRVSPSESKYF